MCKCEDFEKLGYPVKKYSKTGYNSYLPRWEWERKANVSTLYYIISGTVGFLLNGREYLCHENDMFYLSAGERALVFNPSETEKASLYYTVFELEENESLEKMGIERPTNDTAHSFFILFRSLYKTRLAGGAGYELRELSEFFRLLYELIIYRLDTEAPLNANINLEKAVRYMRMNFYKPIRVEELSAIAGYSPSHFRRLFVSNYGVSPNEYLLNYRIERAKELLSEEEGRSVDEVADILGMCNSSYLCKLFKRKTGMSPHKFKNQYSNCEK